MSLLWSGAAAANCLSAAARRPKRFCEDRASSRFAADARLRFDERAVARVTFFPGDLTAGSWTLAKPRLHISLDDEIAQFIAFSDATSSTRVFKQDVPEMHMSHQGSMLTLWSAG